MNEFDPTRSALLLLDFQNYGIHQEGYARSKFEDTRRKAAKFGAMGSTIRATKPRRD